MDRDQFDGVDLNCLFPLVLIKIADILAPNANVTALPKSFSSSQTPSEYRPIF